jgi:hypothetical protein
VSAPKRIFVYHTGVKKPSDNARDHKFQVGQTVYYTTGPGSSGRSDAFKVIQRLPPEGGDYQNRIKSAHEPFDRVVKEGELETAM